MQLNEVKFSEDTRFFKGAKLCNIAAKYSIWCRCAGQDIGDVPLSNWLAMGRVVVHQATNSKDDFLISSITK